VRKADLAHNHRKLDAAIERHRDFMRKCIDAQRVIATAEEKRMLAESVILRLCAQWEQFLDEHIADSINVTPVQLGEYLGAAIPKNPSRDLCVALVFGGTYRDFRSFGDLKGFTKRILPDTENPFLQVTNAHARKIDEVYKIRNYLSHYSAYARRSLARMYNDEYHNTRFLEPGQFLLAYDGQRLWSYFDAFQGASEDMKAWY